MLGGSRVTNTGTSVLAGDLGVSPGTTAPGFDASSVIAGATHLAGPEAGKAQDDLTAAFLDANGRIPTKSNIGELASAVLGPGVYTDGALSLTGLLTLNGGADAVWIFQTPTTLISGAASHIVMTGGATACNVFWVVGSSATLGSHSDFVGTILSMQSISVGTGTTVYGRLLAREAQVTLQSNTIKGCTDFPGNSTGGTTGSGQQTPSAPVDAVIGQPFSQSVVAASAPANPTGSTPSAPVYSVHTGSLPPGLTLNPLTGIISGTPTGIGGTYPFTVTTTTPGTGTTEASYSIDLGPAAAEEEPPVAPSPPPSPSPAPAPAPTVTVASAQLAFTGANFGSLLRMGILLLMTGAAVMTYHRSVRGSRSRRMLQD